MRGQLGRGDSNQRLTARCYDLADYDEDKVDVDGAFDGHSKRSKGHSDKYLIQQNGLNLVNIENGRRPRLKLETNLFGLYEWDLTSCWLSSDAQGKLTPILRP